MKSIALNSLSLDTKAGIVRDLPRKRRVLGPDFVKNYDRNTLFYDALHQPEENCILLIGPRFRSSIESFLRELNVEIDGEKALYQIKDLSGRTSCLKIACSKIDVQAVRLSHPETKWSRIVTPNKSDNQRFNGLNALLAISKNNEIDWVKDWFSFHHKHHSANAIVLFDNGSDKYSVQELRNALTALPGLQEAAIISAPFPFGPVGNKRYHHNSRFFQFSMLRIAQERFLNQANAVLSIDIDELVLPKDGISIFDAAKNSLNGLVSIKGEWRYAQVSESGALLKHKDHLFRQHGAETHISPKWCIDPTGPLKGHAWRLHGIAGVNRDFEQGYKFLHCRQISTSWHYDRRVESNVTLEIAADADFLQFTFTE